MLNKTDKSKQRKPPVILFLTLLLVGLLLVSLYCNTNHLNNNIPTYNSNLDTTNTITNLIDTSHYYIDTTLNNISIDNHIYNLTVVRDKINALNNKRYPIQLLSNSFDPLDFINGVLYHDSTYDLSGVDVSGVDSTYHSSPMTIIITNTNNSKIIYTKSFSLHDLNYIRLYVYHFFKVDSSNPNSQLYLYIENRTDDDYYTDSYYAINVINNKISFFKFPFVEDALSKLYFSNKYDSVVLFVHSFWIVGNVDSDSFEGHKSPHRCAISEYIRHNNGWLNEKTTDTTKFKYDPYFFNDSLFYQINSKEPSLLKSLPVKVKYEDFKKSSS